MTDRPRNGNASPSIWSPKGAFVPLTQKPNSFWCTSDPEDVARVEDRTYICSEDPSDAGPTNNWMDPVDMKTVVTEEYRGAMAGRTMCVIAFCMGSLDAAEPKYGVQITDSEYVAASMHIMTRSGTSVWDKLDTDADFVKCLHSVGAPLRRGQADVPWPCDHTKYISHFPEEGLIWSYGSGYGGNALLGKKCYSLRSPEGTVHYVAPRSPPASRPKTIGSSLTRRCEHRSKTFSLQGMSRSRTTTAPGGESRWSTGRTPSIKKR